MIDIDHKLDRPVPPGHYVVRIRAVLPRIGPRGLSMQMELDPAKVTCGHCRRSAYWFQTYSEAAKQAALEGSEWKGALRYDDKIP